MSVEAHTSLNDCSGDDEKSLPWQVTIMSDSLSYYFILLLALIALVYGQS